MIATRSGEERLAVEADAGGNPTVYGGRFTLVDEQNRVAATVELHPDQGVNGGVRRARVLAAAPKMLAVLRRVHASAYHPDLVKRDPTARALLAIVNEAIAEAEGRHPDDPSWKERQAARG